MAKANTQKTQADNAQGNKAKAIRDYKASHPDATPSEIAKALAGQGVEVNASRVSTVLGNRQKREKGLDVEMLKATAQFVKGYKGSIESALKAIEQVGKFVELCGSSDNAKKSIEAYVALAETIKS